MGSSPDPTERQHEEDPEVLDLPPETEERLRDFGEDHPEIQAIYVFGSRARRSASSLSDLDVALLVDPDRQLAESPFGPLAHYATKIQAAVGISEVDVVLLQPATPLLAHRVVSEGRVVFCRDESARSRFHARALVRYLDTAHLRKIERLYTRRRLQEDRFGRAE